MEVPEAVEPASRRDLCLGELTVAGAAPTFSERAGFFSVSVEATVSRLCFLRVDLLILVFQGLNGNVVILSFLSRLERGIDERVVLGYTTTPKLLRKRLIT